MEAKAAWDQERAATQHKTAFDAQPIAFSLSQADMDAIFNAWKARTPAFYDSEFNRTNLFNIMLTYLYQKKLSGWNLESFSACFEWAKQNNFLEQAPLRPRGTAKSVPHVFPPFVPPKAEESDAEEQQQIDAAIAQTEAERKAAQSMSFEELQAAARKNYNYDRAARLDGVNHV